MDIEGMRLVLTDGETEHVVLSPDEMHDLCVDSEMQTAFAIGLCVTNEMTKLYLAEHYRVNGIVVIRNLEDFLTLLGHGTRPAEEQE